jgi:hypothetical protein
MWAECADTSWATPGIVHFRCSLGSRLSDSVNEEAKKVSTVGPHSWMAIASNARQAASSGVTQQICESNVARVSGMDRTTPAKA